MGASVRRALWLVTEWMARGLAPHEREAVLGDLAESNRTFAASVGDISGLALRRGAASCTEPRTAIAFFVLVLPLSFFLTALARSTASSVAISLWFWIDNADTHLLQNAGFWVGVTDVMPRLLSACAMLAFYAWSAGTLAVCVSRTTARLLCVMIALMAAVWPVFSAPRYGPQNDAVFHLTFYRVVFPCLLPCIFVLLPALFALRTSRMENA